MKIRIVGGCGSGKTTLAESLSDKYTIPHFDLDQIVWDKTSSTYGVKFDPEHRAKALDSILENQNWIIEGVYYAEWVKQTFLEADKIIILKPSIYIQHYRVIKRFMLRKMGIAHYNQRETFLSLFKQIIWNHRCNKNEIKKIQSLYARADLISFCNQRGSSFKLSAEVHK